jgi:hypothetical protein
VNGFPDPRSAFRADAANARFTGVFAQQPMLTITHSAST